MLAEWKEKADKGDVLAAYQIGRAFETGNTAYPVESPNLAQAVTWYNRAVSGGNLNATYHLGVLIASKKVLVTDSTGGTMHADMLSGRKMMDYAVQHGYDPVSDSARLPSAGSEDSTAAMVVGVAAALVLFGALASSNNSDSGGNSTAGTGTGLTQCKIPQFNAVSAETTYVPAFGDACTAWGARPY
jgi:TPR repeat protein